MKKSIYSYAFLGLAILAVSVFTASTLANGFGFNNVSISVENLPDESNYIYTNEWKLTKIEGRNIKGEKAFLKFDEKKNSAGGNGGCNFVSGKFTKNGNQIKMSEIAVTVMACKDVMEDEYKFVTALERIDEYEIKDGKLLLMENKAVVLEFEVKN